MNDSGGLSPREHAEMRDLVLAGTQRIRPQHARRVSLMTAAVAVTLVAAVTGGAVTTAALISSDRDAPSVSSPEPTTSPESTPTPTATPTPTVVPPPAPDPAPPVLEVPSAGTTPFGGECANALTDEEVDALRGIPMVRSDYRWQTGANVVLGGIDCVWVSAEEYLSATIHLFAYPESVVPDEVREGVVPGCQPVNGEGSFVECSVAGTVDGMWLQLRAVARDDQLSAGGVDALYASAVARLSAYAPGVPATRTAKWWPTLDCAALLARIDPMSYGHERVAILDAQGYTGPSTERAEGIPTLAGATSSCDLHFTSGSGDATSGEVVRFAVVPGGAIVFQTAVDAELSVPVQVDGAQAAVIAGGLDRYEGSGAVIVATDGVNVLLVTPDMATETAKAAPLAAAALAMLNG